jgi:rhamnosyltransferase
MDKEIAVGFVTYNPSPSLLARLQLLAELGYAIYVFDNSPEDGAVRDFCRSHSSSRYTTCGRNVGLGVGISAVCAKAYYDDHPALLFFDQDTVFMQSTLDFIERFHERNRAMAAAYSAIVFDAADVGGASDQGLPEVKDVLLAISSGSLFFLKNLSRLKWHNPSYFVDCVDYELCLRSSSMGLKVGRCSSTPGFDHQAEQPDETYRILGRDWRIRKYSPRRIVDALTASTRLIGTALFTGNLRFLGAMVRSVAIYSGFQILVRLMPSPNRRKRTEK